MSDQLQLVLLKKHSWQRKLSLREAYLPMKPIYLLWAIALSLPFVLKFSLPAILHGQRLAIAAPNESFYRVQTIQGHTLTVVAPNGSTQQIQLAGLASSPSRWQREATGILTLLLHASEGQVSIQTMSPNPAGQTVALVKLPNGTLLQQILLAQGLAKLDPHQRSDLPPDVQIALQQAQASAQKEHKNAWGDL
jgi:endonuclease YncB( thermonuclease family)